MTTRDAAGPAARFCASERRTPLSAHSTASNTSNASARERISGKLDERLNDPSRRAPRVFLHVISRIHRLIPSRLRNRVPVTFIGYALINGSAFLIDISFLWLFFDKLHWLYPLAVTLGYMIAGAYSLLLNRWLNFQSRGHLVSQGSRYAVGLASQYVIFILGLTSFLYWIGVHAELARLISACCEGAYLYTLMKLWVFRGTPEPDDDDGPGTPVAA